MTTDRMANRGELINSINTEKRTSTVRFAVLWIPTEKEPEKTDASAEGRATGNSANDVAISLSMAAWNDLMVFHSMVSGRIRYANRYPSPWMVWMYLDGCDFSPSFSRKRFT